MHSFNNLLQKFIRDELSQQELQAFLVLARDPSNEVAIGDAIAEQLDTAPISDLTAGLDVDHQFRQALKKADAVMAAENRPAPIHRVHFLFRKWWAAAAILLLIAGGALVRIKQDQKTTQTAVVEPVDVAPGKAGAILTLADGTQVVLDSLGSGFIATQNGTQVVLQNGRLTYDAAGTLNENVAYNTMTTPKGRQFELLLPDGTKVWLNAASSIQYPIAFHGKERRVIVTGEAYFEVAKDPKKPFIVDLNKQVAVEVLGTHFNVNGYQDDGATIATLLEGSVRVTTGDQLHGQEVSRDGPPGHQEYMLVPGQQAIVNQPGGSRNRVQIKPADLDKVMAWKNGFFNFEGASIREVMKQLERWYDITVVFEKGIPDIIFFGEMSRNVNLNELIAILNEMKLGVQIRLDPDKRLIFSH